MFENGFFGLFKSGDKDKPATTQEPTWNPATMTMEPPRNYSGSSSTEQGQQSQQEQLRLRGGGSTGNICCGVCAGILCFECCC
ncbi:hypothetical protein VTN49DRAFT_4111 [Thermomyces lanuginosus]|uniref:uncharacterized protein n=1 Tax=Thermomyces lanuginosus TaxID=5541 RepID=UPI003742FA33